MFFLRQIFLCFALLVSASFANAGQAAEYVNSFFELWLKDHHFSSFEKRKEGIFFPSKAILLDGEIYEAKEIKANTFYYVESRISVAFKNGRKLDDFVIGAGKKADEAFYDSLRNFCLTTLHPIYAELFDHSDPHVRKQSWPVRGVQRRVFLSEWGHRGSPISEAFQNEVESALAKEVANTPLSRELHWVKLVVFLNEGQVKELVVTIDGERNDVLTRKLEALAWPMPKDFSMSKLFFVIGEI